MSIKKSSMALLIVKDERLVIGTHRDAVIVRDKVSPFAVDHDPNGKERLGVHESSEIVCDHRRKTYLFVRFKASQL
jgi:hypothetical protein